ncbi:MAG: hypothetical protein J7J34_03885, partial [Thermoplasmata archaeon]|nr:hypothetical protein [Thermoplasmata archaeon]
MTGKVAISLFIVMMFLAGNAVYVNGDTESRHISLNFSSPEIEIDGKYASLTFKGTQNLSSPGYPSMPYKSEVLTFPFGTRIESIDVKVDNIQTMHIGKKIIPAAEPVRADMSNAKLIRKEGEI